MKRAFLILILAGFLTACGGGGGGAAPSVNSDDSPPPEETRRLTPAEQAEVRTAADALLNDLDSLENNTEADSLRQEIDALIADINAARHTIEELQNEIANLRSEIDTLKVAETQTEPPPLNCGANEEIIGGSCECISGYVQQNGVCELPPPNCDANEIADGQNCVCADGYRLNAKGACICIDSSRRNNFGICEMIPPNCGANEKADGQNCVCVDGYQRNNSGMCEMIPPIVLSPCDDGQDRVDGNCPPPQLPVCDGMNEVLRNGRCECRDGYVQNNNEICEMIPPPCSDFRERNAQGICTYNTPEFRRNPVLSLANPLPAYEAGAFGQGVTVMLIDDGFLNTHEDLAGQFDETPLTLSGQENRFANARHGTQQAGILAAIRGNGKGSHGIAPSVRILPLDNRGSNLPKILSLMVSLDIPISSHSYVRTLSMYPYSDITVITENETFIRGAHGWADILGDHEHVMVWGAGNGGQNTPPVQFENIWGHYPLIEKELEDNFLIVVALHPGNTIDNHSDGCGVGKMWCIGAIGDGHYAPDNTRFGPYSTNASNTSAATPVVSGALALLKSFRPELKMTVIRQVLLESARPLGTRKNDGMPDEVFGWGAVDVGNGIATLQAMQTADGMAYSDLRKSLPSEFSHLRGRMESVSVALRITDRSYYNMRLSDIVGGGDSQKTSLGNAAKEMQAGDSLLPENSGFGFNYANGDYDLHYAGGGENAFRFSGGLRHDDSQSSYIGEGSSPFAAENTSDTGGYVKWTTADYAGLSAFGEYGRTQIKADYDSNSFVSKIQNARAEEWTAGFQYRDLFLHNDSLRFSARQESRISGGEMVLHYPVADGDSHKAFIGESVQTIRTETAKIPIKQKPQTIYTAGYSQKTENSKWSAAAEWNAGTNAKGVSFAVELQIR